MLLTHVRLVFRTFLLLPSVSFVVVTFLHQQQEHAIHEIESAAVSGWCSEWDRLQLTNQVKLVLSGCPRVDRCDGCLGCMLPAWDVRPTTSSFFGLFAAIG